MPEDDILNQDDIDNLLAEMKEEQGGDAEKQGAQPETAPEAGSGDPNMDPAAWGLSEDDLAKEKAQKAAGGAIEPGQQQAMPMQQFQHQEVSGGQSRSLEFVLDIPLVLTVEVGRTRMSIGDLLNLGPGSIVELTKLAGEPLEIFINNKLVARGEAVIVNEKFGVRLTDVISKAERIESLQ